MSKESYIIVLQIVFLFGSLIGTLLSLCSATYPISVRTRFWWYLVYIVTINASLLSVTTFKFSINLNVVSKCEMLRLKVISAFNQL